MAIYQGHNEDSSGNLLLSIGNGMTATVETGPTASQAYTKGSYLFFNNRLCKAASAISSGATLTIGGNLTQTSLGAEITSHLRSSDGKEFYFDVKNGQYGYYPSASKTASEFVPFGGTAQSTYRFNAFCSNGTSNHSIYLTKDMVKGFTKFKITTESGTPHSYFYAVASTSTSVTMTSGTSYNIPAFTGDADLRIGVVVSKNDVIINVNYRLDLI